VLEDSGFNLPPTTVRKLLNAVDMNQDGVVEYGEFIPVALEMLKARKGPATAQDPLMALLDADLERVLSSQSSESRNSAAETLSRLET